MSHIWLYFYAKECELDFGDGRSQRISRSYHYLVINKGQCCHKCKQIHNLQSRARHALSNLKVILYPKCAICCRDSNGY